MAWDPRRGSRPPARNATAIVVVWHSTQTDHRSFSFVRRSLVVVARRLVFGPLFIPCAVVIIVLRSGVSHSDAIAMRSDCRPGALIFSARVRRACSHNNNWLTDWLHVEAFVDGHNDRRTHAAAVANSCRRRHGTGRSRVWRTAGTAVGHQAEERTTDRRAVPQESVWSTTHSCNGRVRMVDAFTGRQTSHLGCCWVSSTACRLPGSCFVESQQKQPYNGLSMGNNKCWNRYD